MTILVTTHTQSFERLLLKDREKHGTRYFYRQLQSEGKFTSTYSSIQRHYLPTTVWTISHLPTWIFHQPFYLWPQCPFNEIPYPAPEERYSPFFSVLEITATRFVRTKSCIRKQVYSTNIRKQHTIKIQVRQRKMSHLSNGPS